MTYYPTRIIPKIQTRLNLRGEVAKEGKLARHLHLRHLEPYAPRMPRPPKLFQEALFAYT